MIPGILNRAFALHKHLLHQWTVAPSMTKLRSDSKRMMVANVRLALCILAIPENQLQSLLHSQRMRLPHLIYDDSRRFE